MAYNIYIKKVIIKLNVKRINLISLLEADTFIYYTY
jgi:hypothetical protein